MPAVANTAWHKRRDRLTKRDRHPRETKPRKAVDEGGVAHQCLHTLRKQLHLAGCTVLPVDSILVGEGAVGQLLGIMAASPRELVLFLPSFLELLGEGGCWFGTHSLNIQEQESCLG